MESPKIRVTANFWETPLFSMRTVSQASSQSCRRVDADAWSKWTFNPCNEWMNFALNTITDKNWLAYCPANEVSEDSSSLSCENIAICTFCAWTLYKNTVIYNWSHLHRVLLLQPCETRCQGHEVNLKSVDSVCNTNDSAWLRVRKILFRSRFSLAKWVDLMSTTLWIVPLRTSLVIMSNTFWQTIQLFLFTMNSVLTNNTVVPIYNEFSFDKQYSCSHLQWVQFWQMIQMFLFTMNSVITSNMFGPFKTSYKLVQLTTSSATYNQYTWSNYMD